MGMTLQSVLVTVQVWCESEHLATFSQLCFLHILDNTNRNPMSYSVCCGTGFPECYKNLLYQEDTLLLVLPCQWFSWDGDRNGLGLGRSLEIAVVKQPESRWFKSCSNYLSLFTTIYVLYISIRHDVLPTLIWLLFLFVFCFDYLGPWKKSEKLLIDGLKKLLEPTSYVGQPLYL